MKNASNLEMKEQPQETTPEFCLIISSQYPDGKQFQATQDEVTKDRDNIKKVFNDCIFELTVPTGKLPKSTLNACKAQIIKLAATLKNNQHESIGIALNTHGVAGQYDIDTQLVRDVVALLSEHKIKITAMYALFCCAFEYSTKKDSVAVRIAKSLRQLPTSMRQDFKIMGFKHAYDPGVKDDADQVKNILHGLAEHALFVETASVETASVETASVEMASVETASVETSLEETAKSLAAEFFAAKDFKEKKKQTDQETTPASSAPVTPTNNRQQSLFALHKKELEGPNETPDKKKPYGELKN